MSAQADKPNEEYIYIGVNFAFIWLFMIIVYNMCFHASHFGIFNQFSFFFCDKCLINWNNRKIQLFKKLNILEFWTQRVSASWNVDPCIIAVKTERAF